MKRYKVNIFENDEVIRREVVLYEDAQIEKGQAFEEGLKAGRNEDAMKRIKELEADRWIPVSERLPENGISVLTIDSNGNHALDRYKAGTSENWSITHMVNRMGRHDDDYDEAIVTHWMPLPSPPETDE